MALAVRSAQLGRRAPLIGLLSVTLLCGLVFLGVKTAEYRQKWHHRLVPGQARIEYFFSAKRTDGVSAPPAKEFLPEGEGQAQYRQYVRQHLAHAGEEILTEEQLQGRIANLRSFMGIYFTLTGLHALHVIIGMGVIFWILVGAIRGRFGPRRFTAVDLVGLYWHLVDLIWIYLFPLLYLIH
ncbi:MAG: cytochrome c oxidase subunit 3 [Pirellulales bacterium]|nr:cytochrome c oxidase subunit 3 [Pirellulales bacterium]